MFRKAIFAACVAAASAFAPTLPVSGASQRTSAVSGEPTRFLCSVAAAVRSGITEIRRPEDKFDVRSTEIYH